MTSWIQAADGSLQESAQAASSLVSRLTSLDFWLGAPLRILVIISLGVLLHLFLRLVIRKVTDSIARGATSRVVPAQQKDQPQKQARRSKLARAWMTDSSQASIRQAQRAQTIGSVLRSISSLSITAITIVMIIAELGFNVAPVLASASVVGVALSFGAQSLVKDFLTGIFIVAEDQLGIGDWVTLGDQSGRVEAVGLRTTQVRDEKGTLWHVRNGEILKVGNSSQGWAQLLLDLALPADTDLDQQVPIILDACAQALTKPDIAPAVVGKTKYLGLESLDEDQLVIRLRITLAPAAQQRVEPRIRQELKKALKGQGLQLILR